MKNAWLTANFLAFLFFIVASPLAAQDTDFTRAQQAVNQQQYDQAIMLLNGWLKTHPNDTGARYLLARVYSWQQKFQLALPLYNSLLADEPDNSDYLLGKAQVLVWQQKPDSALPILRRARTVSPDYQTLWRLELQALQSISTPESSARFNRLLTEAEHRFPGASWLTSLRAPANEPVTEIEGGTSHHRLDNDLPSWQEYYVTAQHSLSSNNRIFGKVWSVDRYNLTDRQLSMGYHRKLNDHWFANVDAGISSTHDILPEWSIHANAVRRLPGSWSISSGLQHRKYRFVDTDIATLNIERYWSNFRLGGTLYVTSIDGSTIEQETKTSYMVSAGYYYANQSNTGLSLATGDELEYDGTSSPLVTDISNISIFGKHWLLNRKWAITYHIERQKQGNIYTRYGFRLGLRYRL